MPAEAAMLITMGIMTATVPVLLTKAPMSAVTSITRMKSTFSFFPPIRRIRLLIILARPVRKIPAPTTNSPTIMITTGLANPESASEGVRMPPTSRASRAHSATISDRTLPLMKKKHETSRMPRVVTEGENKDSIPFYYRMFIGLAR